MNNNATVRGTLEMDEFDQPKMGTTLNVLTILTFIGCFIQLMFTVFGYFSAKTNFEEKDETLRKMQAEDMPAFAKNMIPDPVIYEKMISQQYINRIPILILSLIAIALCFYGALQMRKLKKQGYLFYIIGQVLPYISMALFIGLFSFQGVFFYIAVGLTLLFILLYTSQRSRLVY